MENPNSVWLIDLDETLLSINSFRLWVRHSLRSRLWWRTLLLLAQRKLLKMPHAQCKQHLQRLWQHPDMKPALNKLISELEHTIRPNMQPILTQIVAREVDAILVTAAAEIYAKPFAEHIGFVHVIASTCHDAETLGVENRGEEKCRSALAYLAKQGWSQRQKITFTDHLEDTPLMLASDRIMWFGSANDLRHLQTIAPHHTIIHCLEIECFPI